MGVGWCRVFVFFLEAFLEFLEASAEHVRFTLLAVRACDYDSNWLRVRSWALSGNHGDSTQASRSEGWGRVYKRKLVAVARKRGVNARQVGGF